MHALTQRLAALAGSAGFVQTGESWRVQITPDVFTGERLNIGVAVRLPSGATRVKVMSEPGRLTCFYGDIGAENILFAAQLYKSAIEAGLPSPVTNIVEADPEPIFNTDPDVALLSLFNDQVSAARTETRQSGEDDTVRREKLVAEVYDFIRKKVPMSADEIIPQSAMAIIATPKGTRPARVPIQGKDVFAGLESAAVRTAHTIQFNLMNALLDVEVACRAKNITRMGMFILRPTTQSERWNTLVDNAIDRVLWRAPAECHFDDDTSAERLSEKIIDFSLRKAA